MEWDIIRYNSLRQLAEIVIDIDSAKYSDVGVELFPGGSGSLPTTPVRGNPARVFIKTDFIPACLEFLKSIPNPFHLLSGSSDLPGCNTHEFAKWMRENTRIQTWCGNNLQEWEPWMLCIPIGFEERGRTGREPENLIGLFQHRNEPKEIDIYLPYLGATHASRTTLVSRLRADHPRVTIEHERLSFTNYINKLSRSRYVICPRGNGMDTLRCYEAAAAGAIPIVLRNELWPMYRRLGFVIVQSIEEIDGLPKYAAFDTDVTMRLSFSYISNQIFLHQMTNLRTDFAYSPGNTE